MELEAATRSVVYLPGGSALLASFGSVIETRSDSKAMAKKFWTDVEGWARECIDWQGETPNFAPYQVESWKALLDPPSGFSNRVCVRGPRGCGKSFSEAMQLLHFATTRHGAGVEWKVITTAGSLGQLRRYLWPEVHKWLARLRWDRLGFEWRPGREIGRWEIKGIGGSLATQAAPSNHVLIEGAHAKELLFLFDESKAIADGTWDACQGAFFNAGRRGNKGYWRADSTPGPSEGRFYDIHSRKRGLRNWWTRHIKTEEAIAADMLNPESVQEMLELYGPGSRMYRNHVEAEFSDSAGGQVVLPLSWVEAAVERWYEWLEEQVPRETLPKAPNGESLPKNQELRIWWDRVTPKLPKLQQLGVDVGGGGPGRDPAALVPVYGQLRGGWTGPVIVGLVDMLEGSEIQLVDEIERRLPERYVVDSVNAATVVERLRKRTKIPVAACNSSLPSDRKDRTGQLTFLNVRSEMWWAMHEGLDPSQDPRVMLPDDRTLIGELTEPEWDNRNLSSKVQIESKKEIARRVRKQMGREDEGGSTNRADGCVMGYWPRAAQLVGGGGGVSLVNPRSGSNTGRIG